MSYTELLLAGFLGLTLGIFIIRVKSLKLALLRLTEDAEKNTITINGLRGDLVDNQRHYAKSTEAHSALQNEVRLLEHRIISSNEAFLEATRIAENLRAANLETKENTQRLIEEIQGLEIALAHQESSRVQLDGEIKQRDREISLLQSEIAKKERLITNQGDTNRILFNGLSESRESVSQLQSEISEHKKELELLRSHVSIYEEIESLKLKLEAHESAYEPIASGLYALTLDASTPDELKKELEEIRRELAAMIQNKTAAICSTKWTINGSRSEGTRSTKHQIRLMLRTFNADSDACLNLVRWNNLDRCIDRLKSSFEFVNDLGSTHNTALQKPYLDARIRQLQIMHRYKESLYRHKELLRTARATEAEERRACREIERARLDAELEEKRYAKALARAREEASFLIGTEHERMLVIIADLETKLAAATELKQRAISMAQITKAGFVYVVSNIGSFGPDVLKIGMTRRIDPQERVRELGGASVPFHFDVHAMIYSDNAPALENSFHRRFARQRINLANGRKEFFRVTLQDVTRFAEELSLSAEFSAAPEAKDYHLSIQLRSQILDSLSDDELNARITAMADANGSQVDYDSEDNTESF